MTRVRSPRPRRVIVSDGDVPPGHARIYLAESRRSRRAQRMVRAALAGGWGRETQFRLWDEIEPRWRIYLEHHRAMTGHFLGAIVDWANEPGEMKQPDPIGPFPERPEGYSQFAVGLTRMGGFLEQPWRRLVVQMLRSRMRGGRVTMSFTHDELNDIRFALSREDLIRTLSLILRDGDHCSQSDALEIETQAMVDTTLVLHREIDGDRHVLRLWVRER